MTCKAFAFGFGGNVVDLEFHRTAIMDARQNFIVFGVIGENVVDACVYARGQQPNVQVVNLGDAFGFGETFAEFVSTEDTVALFSGMSMLAKSIDRRSRPRELRNRL